MPVKLFVLRASVQICGCYSCRLFNTSES